MVQNMICTIGNMTKLSIIITNTAIGLRGISLFGEVKVLELFLSIEAQEAMESGLSEIFREVNQKLFFVTNSKAGLENLNNYGMEFRTISIIPTCVDDSVWKVLGWKERAKIWRKKREADIRLRIDYNRFISESVENRRLLFVDVIIRSIQRIQEQSREDFKGDLLICDILSALDVQQTQLERLYGEKTGAKTGDGSLS